MKAGLLDTPIVIQRLDVTESDYGSNNSEWVDFIHTRARVLVRGGGSGVTNHELVTTYNQGFEIRFYHLKHINESMRILLYGRPYQIKQIIPDVKGQKLTIYTETVNE